jgi:predicted DCC family thiol-disulfide oxidoreductase YuxK
VLSRQVLLFDGVCNLCNGFVNFVIARDPNGKFKFAALQGTAGQAIMRSIGRDPTDMSTLVEAPAPTPSPTSHLAAKQAAKQATPLQVLVDAGEVFVRSEAVLRVVRSAPPRARGDAPLRCCDLLRNGLASCGRHIMGFARGRRRA